MFYRDLIVWQKSMKLVNEIYELSKKFPRNEEFGLKSQLRRCAVSVPSNIAEGYGRKSTKEYMRFLRFSISSLFELQTQIEICLNQQMLSQSSFDFVFEKTREIDRMLSRLLLRLGE